MTLRIDVVTLFPESYPGPLGVSIVGGLVLFVGAVAASTPNAAAAQAFVNFLKSPEAVTVFKAKGVTPGA